MFIAAVCVIFLIKLRWPKNKSLSEFVPWATTGGPQSVWVADYYFIVNVLDLPFASPIVVIYR